MLFYALPAIIVATALVECHGKSLRRETATRWKEGSSDLVTVEGIMRHLQYLHDVGNQSRSVGTDGYEASAEYVSSLLENAGYNVTIQTFTSPVPSRDYEKIAMLNKDSQNITTSPVVKSMWLASDEEFAETYNVIAETYHGNEDRVVMAGAHLDSVPTGPGVNDNGSGCATLLEIALRMAQREDKPPNKLRFAFWGAEEVGLVGSSHYFNQTLDQLQRDKISVYLNFDMIASPNFVRFVYQSEGALTSAQQETEEHIESIFVDFFQLHNLPVEPLPMGCSSDHCAGHELGIPTGGIFSGADGLKTMEQTSIYGGTVDQPYDPCYHLVCDDIQNINVQALDEMSHAAAHAIDTFTHTTASSRAPTDPTTLPTLNPTLGPTPSPTPGLMPGTLGPTPSPTPGPTPGLTPNPSPGPTPGTTMVSSCGYIRSFHVIISFLALNPFTILWLW